MHCGRQLDASQVNAEAFRIRPWDIKRFDTAALAEQMPGNIPVELIFRQKLLALEKFEVLCGHDKVNKINHRTD